MTTQPSPRPVIDVQGLEKSYKELEVLRGVEFEVERGSIFALLGSNGAGKTTVVKILSTLLKADAGTASADGFDITRQAANVSESISLKSADGVSAFSYPLIFLPFISSAFVPTHTMPGPVRAFAQHQPVTSIVNAIRDLFAGQPVGTCIWIALAWCVGILVVAYSFALGTYRRRTA